MEFIYISHNKANTQSKIIMIILIYIV